MQLRRIQQGQTPYVALNLKLCEDIFCMNNITTLLQNRFGDQLKLNEPLKKYTNFRLGGPAAYFVEARNEEDVLDAHKIAVENDVPFFALGGGSNLLVNDAGFVGLVIKMANRDLVIDGNLVTAGSGVLSALLARKTAEAGLAGLEWMISLPGTVGGAVRGNAGGFGGEVRDDLVSAEVFDGNEIITLSHADLKFGYRDSLLKHQAGIIISATFKLESGNSEELKNKMDEFLGKRKSSQPLYAGSAGCVFKNLEFDVDSDMQPILEKLDVPVEMQKTKRISAGWIIDQLDLKGTQIGGARISDEHGNFIVNVGGATASDVAQLIALSKTKARNELGLQLHEEVQYLGF